MTSVYTEDNEVLQNLWKQYSEDAEDMPKEKIVEWAKKALEETNALQSFEESHIDIDGLFRQFISEIHEGNEENQQSLSLNYVQAVDFLRWLTNQQKDEANHEEKQQNEQGEKPQNIEKREEGAEGEYQEDNFFQQSKQTNKIKSPEKKNNSEKGYLQAQLTIGNIGSVNIRIGEPGQSHEQSQNVQDSVKLMMNENESAKKIKTQVQNESNNIDQQNMRYDDEINENTTSGPNEFSLEYISKKYKDYLRVIFEHYCKISYATGQDPTFEQIMHKTTIMTINKFMVFCKDFQISKTSLLITRAYLIEIFKKNSECYKEMSFEQFTEALHKISSIAYGTPNKDQKDSNELLTEDVVKLLQFLQISTPAKFRQKMRKLNIQYRSGPKTNAELKVVPQGYRFKFTSNNGKSEEQVKQQIKERKAHRSQKKVFLKEKNFNNSNQHNLSLNKKDNEHKKNIVGASQKGSIPTKQGGAQSEYILNKILTPPIPPSRKMPPKPHNANQTNSNAGYYLPSSNNTPSNSSNQELIRKDLGYAELHKMKQNQGYSKRKISTNSKSREMKGGFKLNSIVEQARIQVMNETPININLRNFENLSQSIATNSREQTQRMKAYDISKINSKMQLINDKLNRDRQVQEELNHLLDMSNEEQDEFLIEHLKRQNKNDVVSKRISTKITQLQNRK